MRTIPLHAGIFAVLSLGMIGIALLSASPFRYLPLLLTLLMGAVLYLSRDWPDRLFYGICASQPLIIACGLLDLWAGLFAVWMSGALAAGLAGRLSSRQDLLFLLLFCVSTFLLAGLVQLANHVSLLPAALGAGLALVLLGLLLRDYQFRKQYAGARP
jgi:hypothetical protein